MSSKLCVHMTQALNRNNHKWLKTLKPMREADPLSISGLIDHNCIAELQFDVPNDGLETVIWDVIKYDVRKIMRLVFFITSPVIHYFSA